MYTLEDMREQIEAHAKQQLDSLAQPTPTASVSDYEAQREQHAEHSA